MPTFGSLFAGIGGFDLGLERAGWTCRWQVEIDAFCQRVLAQHWPRVPRHGDIRSFPAADTEVVDLICGGFPCQPVSQNGHKLAQDDERWLWPEFRRVLRALRPRLVIVENVPGLLLRGFSDVLGGLAEDGFDAEWASVRASAFGSPQSRERLFLVAYAHGGGWPAPLQVFSQDAYRRLPETTWRSVPRWDASGRVWAFPDCDLHGMAYGVSDQMDRLRGLGNAIVPQVAEWIGRRLLNAANEDRSEPHR